MINITYSATIISGMFGLMGAYDIIRMMSLSLGLSASIFSVVASFLNVISTRCQRWPLAALTYIIVIAVLSTFPSTCRHLEKDSKFPSLGYILIHEQISVAKRTRYNDQPGVTCSSLF